MKSRLTSLTHTPEYRHLVRFRRNVSVTLSLIMGVAYFSFIVAIAFDPQLLGRPIAPGSVISLGIPIGVGLILLAVILTGIYVHFSNCVFDPLIETILKNAKSKKVS